MIKTLDKSQEEFLRWCISKKELGPSARAMIKNALREGSYSDTGSRVKVFNELRKELLKEFIKYKRMYLRTFDGAPERSYP